MVIVMKRSLRKGYGSTDVYLRYPNDGGSVGAEKYEVDLVNGIYVVSFVLRPVDDNQREDENGLHEGQRLLFVQIMKDQVIAELTRYRNTHPGGQGIRLEITSRKKTFSFNVTKICGDRFCLA